MRVRVSQSVKQFGWYGKRRRRPGDEFEIAGKHELGSWMVPVIDPETTEIKIPKKRGPKPKGGKHAEERIEQENDRGEHQDGDGIGKVAGSGSGDSDE